MSTDGDSQGEFEGPDQPGGESSESDRPDPSDGLAPPITGGGDPDDGSEPDEDEVLRIIDAEFAELAKELEQILSVPEEWGQESLNTLLTLKEHWSRRILARAGDRPDWRQRLDQVFAATVERMLRESHSEDMHGQVKFKVRPDAVERHGGPLLDAALDSIGKMLATKLKDVIESKIAPALLQQASSEASSAAGQSAEGAEGPDAPKGGSTAPSAGKPTGQAGGGGGRAAERRAGARSGRGKRRRSRSRGGKRAKKGVKGKVRKIRPNPIRAARNREQASESEPSPAAERPEPTEAPTPTGQQAVDVNIDLANILKSWIKPKPKSEPEGSSQSGSDGGEE
jgi:hypothetical protein